MSDTTTQTPPAPSRDKGREISSLIILFGGVLALVAAVYMYLHDGTSAPLIGAISYLLGNTGTVVNWWFGSSNSSQKKDAVISQMATVPVTVGPVAALTSPFNKGS